MPETTWLHTAPVILAQDIGGLIVLIMVIIVGIASSIAEQKKKKQAEQQKQRRGTPQAQRHAHRHDDEGWLPVDDEWDDEEFTDVYKPTPAPASAAPGRGPGESWASASPWQQLVDLKAQVTAAREAYATGQREQRAAEQRRQQAAAAAAAKPAARPSPSHSPSPPASRSGARPRGTRLGRLGRGELARAVVLAEVLGPPVTVGDEPGSRDADALHRQV